jgi:cell division protein FtsL
MSRRPGVLLILLVLVMVSAVAVVYARHQGRKLFIELQALGKERDNMDIEWGQLQL